MCSQIVFMCVVAMPSRQTEAAKEGECQKPNLWRISCSLTVCTAGKEILLEVLLDLSLFGYIITYYNIL